MKVETRPSTRPRRQQDTVPGRVARRAAQHEPERDVVVRVPLGDHLYAYLCRGAKVGDMVEVDSPITGTTATTVVALGRGGYMGPLKRARLIR
jgi:hypothetical protein